MVNIFPSTRIRRTHFSDGVEKAGVKGYTVYNHMLLPTNFGNLQDECIHLKNYVQIWDVAVERQVSVTGKDTQKLLNLISPRDLSKMSDDQCFYIPVIDRNGGMLNDPVLIKINKDKYWFSLADSDFLQYLLGISDALNLDVKIEEPDISPLAIQGPKSDELMSRVFGKDVTSIKFFRYKKLYYKGYEMIVSRSGFSKQGGFEIYVEGSEYAMNLWNTFLEYGSDLNIKVGCPNLIETIESGLLSYGNDITRENTPFEAGLGKFVNSTRDYIGKKNLLSRPINKMIKPISIHGKIPISDRASKIFDKDKEIGLISRATYSMSYKTNVAIGMISKSHWDPGTKIEVLTHEGMRKAVVEKNFWN